MVELGGTRLQAGLMEVPFEGGVGGVLSFAVPLACSSNTRYDENNQSLTKLGEPNEMASTKGQPC